jgi:hypothetical protein
MRLLGVMLVLALVACSKKSTCEKAVAKMMECKQVVGGLLPRSADQMWVTKTEEGQFKNTLIGACDAAVENEETQKKRMQCVAKTDDCSALAKCE